jgi:hypothetical protein
MDHVAGMKLSGLSICRCDREYTLDHSKQLNFWSRMVEMVHQVGGTPVRLETREEYI